MKKNFTILDIIQLVNKKKNLFILVGSSVFIISIIISLLLPVYYKSTAILYPFNPQAYDPRNVNNAANPYGSPFDGDRIMALAESREVQRYIIEKYNLSDRYKIKKTDELADYKVREQFMANLYIAENEYSAIEISFFDQNPDTAAIIVNDIVAKIDELNKKPLTEISQMIFESYKKIVTAKYKGLDSIVTNTNSKNTAQSDIMSLELLRANTDLNTARKSLELINGDFTTLNVIQHAEPIAKKAYPKRLNIVLVSVIISLIITFLVLVMIELYKHPVENESKN